MATEATPLHLVVQDIDDLRELQELIGSQQSSRIVIEVPADATVLSSSDVLEQLRDIAHNLGTVLELTSDDPARRDMARMLGISHEAPLCASPVPADRRQRPSLEQPALDDEPVDPHSAVTVVSNQAHVPAGNQAEDSLQATKATRPAPKPDDQPSFSFVITPPANYRSRPQPARPAARHQPRGEAGSRRRTQSSRLRIISLMALAGVILGLALILVAFLVPSATIVLAPETTPYTAELTYGVAGAAEELDLAIEPVTLSSTMSWEGSIPTTGERVEPDATATGEITLTNPFTTELVVPEGVSVFAADGSEYLTSHEETVPPADPFGSQSFGSTTVQVVAALPGTEGNQEALSITGQLETGIFYQNQQEISGGTVRSIPVVSQADLDNLRAAASAAFQEQADGASAALLTGDQVVLPDSVQVGTIETAFSASAGDDATTLQLTATAPLTASAYSPSELHELARARIVEQVSNANEPGEQVLGRSIWTSEPEPVSAGSPAFKLEAGGVRQAVIDPAEIDRLRADLIGKDETEAAILAGGLTGVTWVDVDYGPNWLRVLREPRLESRIVIEVVD